MLAKQHCLRIGTVKRNFVLALAISLMVISGCVRAKGERLRLATTTSCYNSGLLEVLLTRFQEKTGVKVDVLAVGTGKALGLARCGDCDAILVHAPCLEKELVSSNYGIERTTVMYNYFVLVGPTSDPAKIRESSSVLEAVKKIYGKKVPFVSRGDNSGTFHKEKQLWKEAAIVPIGTWYRQSCQGMAGTLRLTSELGAYTLSDKGTFLALKPRLNLCFLYSKKDALLYNPYSLIIANPEKFPHVHYPKAKKLVEFLNSSECKRIIGDFGKKRWGQSLFIPLEDK